MIAASVVLVTACSIDAVRDWWMGRDGSVLSQIGLVATVVGIGLISIAENTWRAVWRLVPALSRGIFPDLTGRWEGALTSTWENPATKSKTGPIACEITIRQKLFSTSVSLKTAETPATHSKHCILEAYPATARWRIWYSYDNEPAPQVRYRSSPHKGVAWLELAPDTNPEELTGQYYTDRMTAGSIRVRRVATEVG